MRCRRSIRPVLWRKCSACSVTGFSLIILIFILFIFSPIAGDSSAQDISDAMAAQIRSRIESASEGRVFCTKEEPCRSALLPKFYTDRNFAQAWRLDQDARSASAGMLKALRGASAQGLNPEQYHLRKIEAVLSGLDRQGAAESEKVRELTDLELLLTDAFFSYATDLSMGRTDPQKIDANWHIPRNQGSDLVAALEYALTTGDVEPALKEFMPSNPYYAGLIRALATYRAISERGGWPQVPSGKILKKGDTDERIPIIRQRLMMTGDLGTTTTNEANIFDDALEAAVMHFQKRHGLEGDGHVGAVTLAAMNVPAEQRVRQIEVNLERWRWLPRDFGERFIFINIPGFELKVFGNGQTIMSMAIIVGLYAWSTPVFESTMTYVILNPYWKIPPHIAVKEIIPRLGRDPGYLDRERIKILSGNGNVVNPGSIDWGAARRGNFPYLLRQDPGPKNALGRLAFMLPNPYDVYLHDTPERQLFQRAVREFSHGCIRIEKPFDLAFFLFEDDPKWSKEKILVAVDAGKTQKAVLASPIETFVLYFTAWADADGTVEFRPDIYRRDEPLAEALAEAPA